MNTKAAHRKAIAATRKTLAPDWVAIASRRIVNNLQQLDAFQTAGLVALYKAIHGEVDLDALFVSCWTQGKRTCIPVYNRAQKIYALAEVDAGTVYSTGHYGIREPVSAKPIPTEAVDLFTVPGVTFDRRGNRLGRGGGYYDRLLNGFIGTKAAVCFELQLIDAVPCDAHDIPVDYVVTETNIVNVCNEH